MRLINRMALAVEEEVGGWVGPSVMKETWNCAVET